MALPLKQPKALLEEEENVARDPLEAQQKRNKIKPKPCRERGKVTAVTRLVEAQQKA
jgi:hypothetical protein